MQDAFAVLRIVVLCGISSISLLACGVLAVVNVVNLLLLSKVKEHEIAACPNAENEQVFQDGIVWMALAIGLHVILCIATLGRSSASPNGIIGVIVLTAACATPVLTVWSIIKCWHFGLRSLRVSIPKLSYAVLLAPAPIALIEIFFVLWKTGF